MRFEPSAKDGNVTHKLLCFFHPENYPETEIKKTENCTSARTLYNGIHVSLFREKASVQNSHKPFGHEPGNTAEDQGFEKHPEQSAEMEHLNGIFPEQQKNQHSVSEHRR